MSPPKDVARLSGIQAVQTLLTGLPTSKLLSFGSLWDPFTNRQRDSALRGGRTWRRRHRSGHGDAGRERDLIDDRHPGDEVSGLAEAGGRETNLLLVVERHPLPHDLVDPLGDRLLPHREVELLGRRARHRDHGELAFPGLADPAFLRELLYPAGALAGRVAPGQDEPEVAGDEQRDSDERENDAHRTTRLWSVLARAAGSPAGRERAAGRRRQPLPGGERAAPAGRACWNPPAHPWLSPDCRPRPSA